MDMFDMLALVVRLAGSLLHEYCNKLGPNRIWPGQKVGTLWLNQTDHASTIISQPSGETRLIYPYLG
jgi:hypothetical protein